MNIKSFLFWTCAGIVVISGSYLIIRWFARNEQRELANQRDWEMKKIEDKPQREIGFHAVAKDHALAAG